MLTHTKQHTHLGGATLLLPLLPIVRTVGDAQSATHAAIARAERCDNSLHPLGVRVGVSEGVGEDDGRGRMKVRLSEVVR